MTKDDDFKLFRGFEDKRTDISGCRVVFLPKRRNVFKSLRRRKGGSEMTTEND